MENFENIQSVNQTLTDDSKIKTYLLEISKWGKFLAIVAIALIVISFITSIKLDVGLSLGTFGVIYFALAILYYFPVKFLYKFLIQIKKGLESDNNQDITLGFENLKSLFKFTGILTIVILSIYALLLVIGLPIILLIAN